MKKAIQYILSQVARLIDVKSIVTLALVATLVVTTLNDVEVPALFSNSVMLVLGFFFGKTNTVTQREADAVYTGSSESVKQAGKTEKQAENRTGKE